MAGSRQHTIPRFLLKGFASRSQRDEFFTWVFRKGGSNFEANIKNVGVEKNFYGDASQPALDEIITKMEGGFADLVAGLRQPRSAVASLDSRDIAQLVAHLAIRTRQLRAWVIDTTAELLSDIERLLNDDSVFEKAVRVALRRKTSLRSQVRKSLKEFGLNTAKADAAIQKATPEIIDHLRAHRDAIADEISSRMEVFRSQLQPAIREGYIESMTRGLSVPKRAERYEELKWEIVPIDQPLILPDTACIFEVGGSREFAPLDDPEQDLVGAVLPIDSSKALIGTAAGAESTVSTDRLNTASARCSYEFFVSSERTCEIVELQAELGQWSGILSVSEVQRMRQDLEGEFRNPLQWFKEDADT